MTDKTQQPKDLEVVEEVEKTKAEKPVEEKTAKDEKSAENGDAKEKAKGEEKDEKEKNGEPEKEPEGVALWTLIGARQVQREEKVDGGGDATDNKPADEATPEKKAKLDEPAEADSRRRPK
ncbi:hypothetical protein NQ318_021399 [Aromia moschata]|uniref:Uncharacterized protein n=1 Tax=Aromia moschata TaxID=1265417 RepID=A0AAV8ZDP1_9CUCU|nr:hypothetical protein NQ318_021399 [Aromia moschata]